MRRLEIRNYEIGKLIGQSPKFRIYLGETKEGEHLIVKVAKTFEDGDVLAREAGEFNTLRAFEDEVSKYQQLSKNANAHYDWLFVQPLNSFMEPSQGDRRINVYRIPDIDAADLVPLSKLRQNYTIDARTSVWILGRLFKLYSFYELIAAGGDNPVVDYPVFSPDDYLVGPEKHRLIYYNYSESMADVVAYDFVKAIASFALEWIETEDDASLRYRSLIEDFAQHGRDSFGEAHEELYSLVEELWGISYHPFTYRHPKSTIWKTIKED